MSEPNKVERRNFLYVASGVFVAAGGLLATWPLIDSFNPTADVMSLSSVEIDLSHVKVGQAITVKWRGKPVFIRRRTAQEIAHARSVDVSELRDPQTDAQRVKKGREEWLVVIGICTHLGCIPLGQRIGAPRGDYGGWYCPCHGSHYDMAGRIRKGPAPRNLDLPEYEFLTDVFIRIG